MLAKIWKIQKVLNFAHFNPKNTYISTCKNVQVYKTVLQMNSNVHICRLLLMCKWFFYSFFLSPCQVTLSSLFFSQQRKKKVGGAIWIVILHRDTYNITWTQRNIYIHTHTPNHMRFARTMRLLYIKVMFKEENPLIYK